MKVVLEKWWFCLEEKVVGWEGEGNTLMRRVSVYAIAHQHTESLQRFWVCSATSATCTHCHSPPSFSYPFAPLPWESMPMGSSFLFLFLLFSFHHNPNFYLFFSHYLLQMQCMQFFTPISSSIFPIKIQYCFSL